MSTTAFWDAFLRGDPVARRWLGEELPGEMEAQGARFERKGAEEEGAP